LTLERPVPSSVLGVVVVPKSKGQFPALASVVGSPGLSTSIQLCRLMAAIPELAHLPQLGDNWRRALPVWQSAPDTVWSESAASGIGTTTRKVPVVVVFPEPQPSSVAELRQELGFYPAAREVDAGELGGPPGEETPDGHGVVISWPGSAPIQPDFGPDGRWWLRPAVCGEGEPPNLLMTWWAVLFALSALARYHPVEWVAALDADGSAEAVVLELALDVALEVVPELVLEAVLAGEGNGASPP
jgi:hypothetical protein